MRVCDVVRNSVYYDPRVRKQIAEYMRQGIDVCCVGFACNRYDEEKVKQIACPYEIAKIDEKLVGKLGSIYKKLKREYEIQKSVYQAIVRTNAEIIHANDLNALIPAYFAAKKLNCRIIYDSHEINTQNYCAKNKKALLSWVYALFERYLVKHIDLMICVSNAAAKYFEKKYRIKKPMVVTNCCLKREAVAEQTQKNPGFEVLNHGQFYEGRGYELMIEAAALIEDKNVKICQRGFGYLEQQLRDRAAELEAENVVFYPPVKVEELVLMAARSHVGVAITEPVSLNFKLSVSNKLFEYAAAGLPVIMSDIPEHRYLNGKYEFGIILEENTPKCFADAVLKLYGDKEFYKKCKENALKMSMELNWENEFERLIEAEKVLNMIA